MQVVKYMFQLHGDDRGQLIVLEEFKDIPFKIKRVYYMYDTAEGVVRGHHAHKKLEQILVCINGSCKIRLDNGKEKKVVPLEKPYEGLYVTNNMWREMFDFSSDAVLMVLGVLVGIGQFKYHWFLLLPSDDEQQMVITGHEISIELINRAIAEHNCYAQISTTKAEEIAEFLGFEPLYPPIDRSLWEQTEAIAFIYPDYIRISCTYQSAAQKQLYYRISYYNDYENAIYSFEQNLMGIERIICATTVYESDNYSQKALSWISKNAIISLYGTDVETSLLYQLAENMIGGKQ